ncbi:Bax inhibitor-1/YccA family protein [Cellvibrio japonicus]|uniref:Integral membrane protein n=1 Tax=Cellvibrio japonicus (strain Ueda107) TaxID=498211 RepID=B3PEU1_CELJU|nr:Bax inhibitor-1/YccA family protein [Cellvibrio japonicus]ACE85276.1 integral membrane protein [Cellvibrio japonicus Ueda107]QEI12190.1 Bax inhibitor-1/YccA family protein [Cellvibrio japonicus]QEI15764.1 Bax inhibitor-1/YccA family protein [Cellvibrio japonicus]QEI19342.1 Bax inhibitor-1/YccA family protein [Cellvibrio japonicus]
MYEPAHIQTAQSSSPVEVNKVLRNTYMLLGLTLAFSALMAGLSMALGIGRGFGLIMSLAAMALIWFVLPKTANSSAGLGVVFAFTGLIGAGLGPVINHYLSFTNGSAIISQALGGTALVFLTLSAYTLTSRKNFSFMGGFIAVGIIAMLVIMAFLIIASLLGYQFSGLSLAFSAGVILLMSAIILYQTSEIIHGGETNYILATTSLYLSIVNIFTSLLNLLGVTSNE